MLVSGQQLVKEATAGSLDGVSYLLKKGVPCDACDKDGNSALFWASCRGHAAICRALLIYGADVNASTAKTGATPLMASADNNQLACLEGLLRQRNINVDKVNTRGDTALHMSAYRGYARAVQILIQYQADPFVVNSCQRTALDEAETNAHGACVDLLRHYMESRQAPNAHVPVSFNSNDISNGTKSQKEETTLNEIPFVANIQTSQEIDTHTSFKSNSSLLLSLDSGVFESSLSLSSVSSGVFPKACSLISSAPYNSFSSEKPFNDSPYSSLHSFEHAFSGSDLKREMCEPKKANVKEQHSNYPHGDKNYCYCGKSTCRSGVWAQISQNHSPNHSSGNDLQSQPLSIDFNRDRHFSLIEGPNLSDLDEYQSQTHSSKLKDKVGAKPFESLCQRPITRIDSLSEQLDLDLDQLTGNRRHETRTSNNENSGKLKPPPPLLLFDQTENNLSIDNPRSIAGDGCPQPPEQHGYNILPTETQPSSSSPETFPNTCLSHTNNHKNSNQASSCGKREVIKGVEMSEFIENLQMQLIQNGRDLHQEKRRNCELQQQIKKLMEENSKLRETNHKLSLLSVSRSQEGDSISIPSDFSYKDLAGKP